MLCSRATDRGNNKLIESTNSCIFWRHISGRRPRKERKVMAHNFHKKYHVPHDVGVVDGTLFPIEFKPERKDYPDFKGRKGKYTTL